MPEGTSVGTIYFDLALKDTINAQLQAAAARTKAQVQHAFDGVGGTQIQKSNFRHRHPSRPGRRCRLEQERGVGAAQPEQSCPRL